MAIESTESAVVQTLVRALRGSLPYLEEFNHQTFVLYVSGELLEQDATPELMEEIALLHRVGVRLVLVHGSEPQIRAHFGAEKIRLDPDSGQPQVPRAAVAEVQQVIAAVNWEFLTRLQLYGHGILPISGHFVSAKACDPKGAASPETAQGQVHEVQLKALQQLLQIRQTPLLAPLGTGSRGRLWMLEGRRLAAELAVRLQAKKLLFLETEAIPVPQQRQLSTSGLRQWLAQEPDVSVASRWSLECLAMACERGVERCHWLDARSEGVLLAETLTSSGVGLMVTNSAYRQVRPATSADIPRLWTLLAEPMRETAIVQRSPGYLEQHIERYRLFCQDEDILGCCEVIPYPTEKVVEVASLAVASAHRNQGVGRQLVQHVVQDVTALGFREVIALSTREENVFVTCGFERKEWKELPLEKRENYDSPQSRVYGLTLGKERSAD